MTHISPYTFFRYVKRIIFAGLLFTGGGAVGEKHTLQTPSLYHPLVVIDCGSKGSLHTGTCYQALRYAARNIRESGRFSRVLTPVDFTFLYNEEGRIFPVDLISAEDSRIRRKYLDFFKLHYPVEASLVLDENSRYVMIRVEKLVLLTKGEKYEWTEYAFRKGLKVYYYDEPEFSKIAAGRYLFSGGYIRIVPGQKNIWNLDYVYRINRALYSIQGLKQLYSPWHAGKNISRLTSRYNPSRFNEKEFGKIWELTGEFASPYWDQEKNIFYFQYYVASPEISLDKEIAEVLGKNLAKNVSWEIYDSMGSQRRKSVVAENP